MLTTDIRAGWSRARRTSARVIHSPWSGMRAAQAAVASGWESAEQVSREAALGWSALDAKDDNKQLAWSESDNRDHSAASPYGAVPVKDAGLRGAWDMSIERTDLRIMLTYNPKPARKDADTSPRYQRSDEHGPRYDAALERERSLYVPGTGLLAFSFGGQRYAPSTAPNVFFDFRYEPAARVIQPVDSGTTISINKARSVNRFLHLLWGRARALDPVPTGIEYPDYQGPITVIVPPPAEPDILETYMIANSVSVVVLPDRVPLDMTGIRIGRDIDSFAWTLSAQLFGRTSLNQVRPDAAGPKQVEVTINGHVWVFLIERYSGTGKLADERYTLTGASRTQLLAAPYAPARSQVNTAAINAELAASNELINTGFTLEWDTWQLGPPDWTMPAGAFSYQAQTPMQVIAALAETAGGVVSPALADDVLTILPRYRAPVWQWSSAIMDRIIPAAIVSDWGSEWQPLPEWNSCYVSGTNYGVSVDVRRAGTAGDNPAPDVFTDWMTGTDPARSRGTAELCKGGDQEVVTLDLPLFLEATAPGLVTPAQLCEVRDVDETWRGLCLSTEITAEGVGASRVKQTLRLERHHREGA
ncbi:MULTISPECIES: hypothetical protein [Pseudomonas]|uniref:hypothetical protein n=1 Tax=Pseudomonas TaxID=286 RepID=UPI0015AA3235|nr:MULTISPECIES: hypothetical protein [Pseudomonas]